jgi:alpha-L-rhamnosidase
MKTYWGGMIQDGADTFWELYNPQNKEFSPYGSHLINSYCHAWSCTPTYLKRKYNL